MVRLGDLLVKRGIVTPDQLETSLARQTERGARLGTNLIELSVSQDEIATALAYLHGVKAALSADFERQSPSVIASLPRAVVHACTAFPLGFSDEIRGKSLLVCLRDPKDAEALAQVTASTKYPIVPCAAPELLIYFWLERAFDIRREPRFAQSSPQHGGQEPESSMPLALELVDLTQRSGSHLIPPVTNNLPDAIGLRAATGSDVPSLEPSLKSSSLAVLDPEPDPTFEPNSEFDVDIAFEPDPEPEPDAAFEVDIAFDPNPVEVAPETAAPTHEAKPEPMPLPAMPMNEAAQIILTATSSDKIADALIGFMQTAFGAGLILDVDGDTAVGRTGFGGNLGAQSMKSISVRLDEPSVFTQALDTKQGPVPTRSGDAHQRFCELCSISPTPNDGLVAAIRVAERVHWLCYVHGPVGGGLSERAAQLSQLLLTAEEALPWL